MKATKIFLFTLFTSLFFCGLATSADDEIVVLPDKYNIVIMSGDKAVDFAKKCKCKVYLDDEHHIVVLLDLPKEICI